MMNSNKISRKCDIGQYRHYINVIGGSNYISIKVLLGTNLQLLKYVKSH